MIHQQMWIRLLTAALVGIVISALVPRPDHQSWLFGVLVGYLVATLVFSLPLLRFFVRADADETRSRFEEVDASRWEVDVLVICSALTSLAAVAFLLLSGQGKSDAGKSSDAALGLAVVAASWLLLHTLFALRYAKHYLLREPDSIDFNTDEPVRMSDFAYFSFNLGMTYQVSDTNTRTSALRRLVWGHCTLSWIFGTVIIATAINLIVGLAP